ncbi:MAG: NAD-dependent epimerase/dehydratase family protein [Chloroflexi bacterium]|nr:NAD-dependent epimerase/dehydratase family protein [Chloroflexota bacterium]
MEGKRGIQTVLVTGGAGFIASHLVDSLVAVGLRVVIVDNLSSGRRENINPKAEFYPMDITDEGLAGIFKKERPEIVFHYAAQISQRRSFAAPILDAKTNIIGSLNILENCGAYGVNKIIYASSAAVYGYPEYLPCDEEHPIRPTSHYGVSKHVVEHYLHVYQQLYRLEYLVLRYANVFGPRQAHSGDAGVVAIFSQRMRSGEPITIFGDGKQERDFIYVSDVVAANMLALEKSGGIINIGRGQGISIEKIFSEIQRQTSYRREPKYAPAPVGEVPRNYLDVRKAARELNWRPVVGIEEGLLKTLLSLMPS